MELLRGEMKTDGWQERNVKSESRKSKSDGENNESEREKCLEDGWR